MYLLHLAKDRPVYEVKITESGGGNKYGFKYNGNMMEFTTTTDFLNWCENYNCEVFESLKDLMPRRLSFRDTKF